MIDQPGETNVLVTEPRGVVGVIGPWSFPLAIPLGMTAAALVTGNVAVVKPAEQSTWIAAEFVRILHECGVPSDAVSLLPGDAEAGATSFNAYWDGVQLLSQVNPAAGFHTYTFDVVGDALDPAGPRSKLYDPAFSHGYRSGRAAGEPSAQ